MNVVPLEREEIEANFSNFWILYPRHVAKKDALKAWNKIDAKLYPEILTALAAWRPVYLAREPDKIPHAATFLNGERWEDELPKEYRQAPAKPRDDTPKSSMPEHVRSMIAKLRK